MDKQRIYFVSDLHFGHKNILKYEPNVRGKFNNIDDMNIKLVEEWNSLISKNDIVYNLGDFFFTMKKDDIRKILSQLKFKKMIIVIGNHDLSDSRKVFSEYKNIEVVYGYRLKYNHKIYELSHYPMLLGNRKNLFNIHGHIHSKNLDSYYHINVGYDNIGKIALSMEEVEDEVEKLEYEYKELKCLGIN